MPESLTQDQLAAQDWSVWLNGLGNRLRLEGRGYRDGVAISSSDAYKLRRCAVKLLVHMCPEDISVARIPASSVLISASGRSYSMSVSMPGDSETKIVLVLDYSSDLQQPIYYRWCAALGEAVIAGNYHNVELIRERLTEDLANIRDMIARITMSRIVDQQALVELGLGEGAQARPLTVVSLFDPVFKMDCEGDSLPP